METFINFCSGRGFVYRSGFLWKKETEQMQEQSQQQIKDEIKPASKQAYEECQDAIDYFCSMMEVKNSS